MSRFPSSPWYNQAEDHNIWRKVYPMTCRGIKHPRTSGFVFDDERNMWVCAHCRRPSIHNEAYVRECLGCETPFVVWEFKESQVNREFCGDCGGTNIAQPNVVTESPDQRYKRYLDESA